MTAGAPEERFVTVADAVAGTRWEIGGLRAGGDEGRHDWRRGAG
ncbi:MAG: hypothetical protein ACFCVK_10415 [Acidimicrobiales bacterium]